MYVRDGYFAGLILHEDDLQWLERSYEDYLNACAELQRIGYSDIPKRNELMLRKKTKREAVERFIKQHGDLDVQYSRKYKQIFKRLFGEN